MINLLAGEWVEPNYGFIHMYALTMTLGVFIAVLASYLRLRIKQVPSIELIYAAGAIVPIALLGASFVAKASLPDYSDRPWAWFAFWEPGMSIHGGVYFGVFAGVFIFYFIGKKNKVSLWVYGDAILPNILLGQAIGRWGNFFNHELPGSPVTLAANGNPYWFVPDWIMDNMIYNVNGKEYYMEPNFLFESFGLTLAWIMIIIIVPIIFKSCSKKPWKVHPNVFTFDLKYNFQYIFKKDSSRLTTYQIWNRAYYKNIHIEYSEKYKTFCSKYNKQNWFADRIAHGKVLEKLNNPDGYYVMRSGVQGGLYFALWNVVRIVLEVRKDPNDMFVTDNAPLSYGLISLTLVIGLLIAVYSQFIAPYFRKEGWQYEKPYFIVE